MPRTAAASTATNCLQAIVVTLATLLIGGNYAEVPVTCSDGGICVPPYLCSSNGSVKQFGEGLIDTRSSANDDTECPEQLMCCRLELAVPSPPVEDTCEGGSCVLASQCADAAASNSINLRFSTTDRGCPGGRVCCQNASKTCDGQCTVPERCDDAGVDLRFSVGTCPENEICCSKPQLWSNSSEPVCGGECVDADECPQSSRSLVDLRRDGADGCPGNQICCVIEALKKKSCDGECVPAAQCNGNGKVIDLRFDDGSCPKDRVCCKDQPSAKPACKCMPYKECSKLINLRFSNECAFNQVCCDENSTVNISSTGSSCDGACVPLQRCPELQTSKEAVDLRLSDSSCSTNLVCCKNPVDLCEGKCVPMDQCADKAIGSVDLRLSHTSCPVKQICCKALRKPTPQTVSILPVTRKNLTANISSAGSSCDGACVPLQRCPELQTSKGIVDLRFSDSSCSTNLVCCKNPVDSCEGKCVPMDQCADKAIGSIDLRFSHTSCPVEQICCKALRQPTSQTVDILPVTRKSCDGKCVPKQQCNIYSSTHVDLRISDDSCPANLVCCNQTQTTKLSTCTGSCVPRNLCSDTISSNDLINLRYDSGGCSGDQICCAKVKKPLTCDGSCVTEDQCQDSTLGIDLRFSEKACPMNRICCRHVKTSHQPTPSCKCVPFQFCPELKVGKVMIDLRFDEWNCPAGTVCCKNPTDSCICTSIEQCADAPRSKAMFDLRSDAFKCPIGQTCCKQLRHPQYPMQTMTHSQLAETCDGECVPYQQCPAIAIGRATVDLRLSARSCPADQICCKPQCNGVCVSQERCGDVTSGIDLRFNDKACSANQVCCRNPLNIYEPIITDENHTPTESTCPGKCVPRGQCPLGNHLDLRVNIATCPHDQVCCTLQMVPSILPPSIDLGFPDIPGPLQTEPPTTDDSGCNVQINPRSTTVTKADIPWLVSVWSRQDYFGATRNQYECVGTLLSADLILTSADCVSEFGAEQIYVRIGDFNLKPLQTLSRRREYTVKSITRHPDYENRSGSANVAVIRLNKTPPSTSFMCLNQNTQPSRNENCILIGWNKQTLPNDTIRNAFPEKHQLQLPSTAACPEGLLCSGRPATASQCDQLQGSPLICAAANGQYWRQAGIVMHSASTSCDDFGVPEAFVSVGSYSAWIHEQISPSFQQVTKVAEPSRLYLPAAV